eukprot:CAMPEP_0170647724 /NCGR_PEP_ID=MMETSP0224-20130122/44335_1 /TAXON_ID=285029 /ORGANISM="Togula jolla, Strain CCCM 725" /LENGTH=50 /DNA_ID=CAMNT_0010979165 /DNA_START=28 /DNA_END=177 /DNA_ORIENTATION=+
MAVCRAKPDGALAQHYVARLIQLSVPHFGDFLGQCGGTNGKEDGAARCPR